MNSKSGSILALLWLLATSAAVAHHSATVYDLTKVISVTGFLKEFHFQNPHTIWILAVSDAAGKTHTLQIEGNPPNWFRSAGIRKADFEKGLNERVTMDIHPSKDGSAVGYFQKITFADGTFVRFGDTVQ